MVEEGDAERDCAADRCIGRKIETEESGVGKTVREMK